MPLSTGAPNTTDYRLGRGIGRFKLTGQAAYRDMGNLPEFVLTLTKEELTHKSSRSGLAVTDKRIVISQEAGLRIVADEMNMTNLAEWLSGSTTTHDNPHDTTFAATANILANANLVLNRWYELTNVAGERVYALGATGCVYTLVEDPAGTPVTLTEGTDYEIDEDIGLVKFKAGGPATLVAGNTIGFAITTGATVAQDMAQVNGLSATAITGALLFVEENAADGTKREFFFPKVTLSAEGDLSLIGEALQQMTFTGVAEVDSSQPAGEQVVRIRDLL